MSCWTVQLQGPEGDSHATVSVGQKVYFFGASYNDDQMEVRVFNTVCLRWTTLPLASAGTVDVPSMRRGHTAVLVGDIVYIWGGRDYVYNPRIGSMYCNALYSFDVGTHRWFRPKVSGMVPEGRFTHTACALGKDIYVHGGVVLGSTYDRYFNDIHKLNTSTMVWTLIDNRGSSPPAAWHSANIIGTKMYVFGGEVFRNKYCKNIRVFDIETNRWLSTPRQHTEGRCQQSAFVYNGELYIFGGYGSKIFNDLWRFNPETFSWKEVQPRRSAHGARSILDSICCSVVGDSAVFIGNSRLYILDLKPLLKTFCKLAVLKHNLDQSGLPCDIRWELEAMNHQQEK